MPPKKGPKAPGGLTLTRAIGPQDIKLLNKLTSDPGGAGIFSSIGLTSCQLEELGRFNFNSWEDLVKKTGVTPETLKLIQETFRLHLVATAADGWVEKPCWVEGLVAELPSNLSPFSNGRTELCAVNWGRPRLLRACPNRVWLQWHQPASMVP